MKTCPSLRPFLGAVIALFPAALVHSEVSFQNLPPAGDFIGMGQPGALSADGSTVVGSGWSVAKWQGESFRWTPAGGVQFLETSLPLASRGHGVSGDGSVVGGQRFSDYGSAFCWINGVMKSMVANRSSVVCDVSKDGRLVVGSNPAANTIAPVATQWSVSSAGTAAAVSLGDLAGGVTESEAKRISGNGTTIVGWGSSANGVEAFRKQGSGSLVGLGDLTGGKFFSEANAVSTDGSVVVGRSHSAKGPEAFRWTAAGGMTALGDLRGGAESSEATGVSGDGTIVVGTSASAADTEVFLWTAAGGMRGLAGLCRGLGVDLNGWRFTYSRPVISEDGNVISGDAISPQMDQVLWRLSGVRELVAQAPCVFWQGDGIANMWQTGGTGNWSDGSAATTFAAGQRVLFDDFGSNNPAVELAETLAPSAVIVAANQNYTFGGAGSLSGTMSLHKDGDGRLDLFGNHSFSGGITVAGGTLVIHGIVTDTGNLGVEVLAGATLRIDGGALQAKVHLHPGACLSGLGTIAGDVTNEGWIRQTEVGELAVVSGGMVNRGTVLLKGGASLYVTGTFENHGVVDSITGNLRPPGRLLNNGVMLDSSSVRVDGLMKDGNRVSIGILSSANHVYQLQRGSDPGSSGWVNIGPPQQGTGGLLTFTDPATGHSTGFYRIAVDP